MARIKRAISCLLVALMFIPVQLVIAEGAVTDESQWELVWSDEFTGSSLDESKWAYETGSGHNNEAQYYTEDNVTVSDGTLKITAKRENIEGYEYTSGRLETITDDGEALFSTKYGRIEARIKLPKGEGLWPAFWMQPVEDEYGSWPLSGEIDIMEARGRLVNEVNGAIHFGESRPFNRQLHDSYTFGPNTDITDFHVYAVEWKENTIIWYVDGVEYFRASNWYTMSDDGVISEYPAPFNKEFYIILNLAVGGDYDDGILPSDDMLSSVMEVDYVRVYHDVDGYSETGIKMPAGTRDEDSLSLIPLYENGNLLKDSNFTLINNVIVNIQDVDITTHNWYFTTNKYITGAATISKMVIGDSIYANIDILNPGLQVYAVQLIQQLPLAKGYIYKVSFDAMSPDGNRTIKVKAYGDKNYCSSYVAKLTNTMNTYEFSFLMSEETDLEAMLQMNLGADAKDVVIGNVSVKVINNSAKVIADNIVNNTETVTEFTTEEISAEELEGAVDVEISKPSNEIETLQSVKLGTESSTEMETEAETEAPTETSTESETESRDEVATESFSEQITDAVTESETIADSQAVIQPEMSNNNDNKLSVLEHVNRFKNWLFKR